MSLPPLKFKAVVPARYASTRLPAKPLLDLGGKPMVARVAECAVRSGAEEVWVATDHADVVSAAERHGLSVLLTQMGAKVAVSFLIVALLEQINGQIGAFWRFFALFQHNLPFWRCCTGY